MKKARYKAVVIVIIILFLAAVFVYFRPLRMSDLVNDEQEIVLTQISMGVQNGEPYMDSESYNDLTKEQELLLFWFQMDLYLKQENSWSIFLCMRIQNLSVL